MSERSSLDPYRCTEPPTSLWRVIYPSTRSTIRVSGNMSAASKYIPLNKSELMKAIEKHIVWNNWEPTPFLSLFSDEDHAINWATGWMERHAGVSTEIFIYKIDTTMLLPHVYIFDLDTLKETLGFVHDYSLHEFVFLHRIPKSAIVAKRDLETAMVEGTEAQIAQSELDRIYLLNTPEMAIRSQRPRYDFGGASEDSEGLTEDGQLA